MKLEALYVDWAHGDYSRTDIFDPAMKMDGLVVHYGVYRDWDEARKVRGRPLDQRSTDAIPASS